MTREDPFELAQEREREADELERRSRELGSAVDETREDWERKRADDAVPGAPPPSPSQSPEDDAGEEPRSPAPQAPPPSAGPGDAETPPEGGAGPPADV
jgi:hypothetical protein